MHIKQITEYTPAVHTALESFLNQLTATHAGLTVDFIRELTGSVNSYLFCAADDSGHYIGMITLGIYLSPTGRKGWIEDVVVTESSRGQGAGKQLTQYAIQFAKEKGVQLLMLTSNPSRIAANHLYPSLGFERKETNVYRMILEQ